MRNRNILIMILLSIITLGIYSIYWQVSTKIELNKLGAKIPTAWLIIIPLVNIWWMYEYSKGVEQVTNGKMSTVLSFVLLFLLGMIGGFIIQDAFNKSGGQSAPTDTATPPETPAEQPPTDQTPPTTPQPVA